jgi:hypothetical protein
MVNKIGVPLQVLLAFVNEGVTVIVATTAVGTIIYSGK